MLHYLKSATIGLFQMHVNKVLQRQMMTILALCMLLHMAEHSVAQSIKEDLEKMYHYYGETSNLNISILTKMVPVAGKSSNYVPMVNMHKSGHDFFYAYEHIDFLLDGTDMLLVNKKSKTIYYRPVKEQELDELFKKTSFGALDTLLKSYQKIENVSTLPEVKRYMLHFKKEAAMQKMEVEFAANTGKLNKIIYHYNPEMTPDMKSVEVKYVENTSAYVMPTTGSYMHSTNKKWQTSAAYRGYTIQVVEKLEDEFKEYFKN